MLQGIILVCFVAFVQFYFTSNYFTALELKCFKITKTNRLWLTEILFLCFHKAYIPELRIRLASGDGRVEANPAQVVTDFDVS